MNGRLPENVMHFGRLLRRAGLPVGPGAVLLAIEAASAVGPSRREDFFWALASVFVKRREDLAIYTEAFETFWRDPFGQEQLLSLLLDQAKVETGRPPETSRRIREAWSAPQPRPLPPQRRAEPEEQLDMRLTFSSDELLRTKDFEQMSAEEIARARVLISRMELDVAELRTRRRAPHHRGTIDLRRTLRRSVPTGFGSLAFQRQATRPPALVVLCDISGSMERYSRIFLHFMHTLATLRDRVHAFVFGTRLTNITRLLRHKDVDVALAAVGKGVADWSGGTRIRTSLHELNQRWSRRVLGQGAVVLLVTDGLDRDEAPGLAFEIARLRRSSRRLIWLNPLLRYEGFAPLARGVQILHHEIPEHRPVHSLESLESLITALERP